MINENDYTGLALCPEGVMKPLYSANWVCPWIGMDLIVKNGINCCTLDLEEECIFCPRTCHRSLLPPSCNLIQTMRTSFLVFLKILVQL